jgi:hypothetical protein
VLGAGQCRAVGLYRARGRLHEAQCAIEQRLAPQHLGGATVVLYGLADQWQPERTCSNLAALKLPTIFLTGSGQYAVQQCRGAHGIVVQGSFVFVALWTPSRHARFCSPLRVTRLQDHHT